MDLLANVDVPDLARAIAFYRDGLGLRLGRRLGPEIAEMLGATSAIYLLERQAGTLPAPRGPDVRRYARHWTPVHLDFVVPDVLAAVEKAQAAGARVEQAAAEFEWGHLAVLSDPFGHGFCLVQFSARGYDAMAQIEE